jgi:Ulp1 family protease
MSIGKKAVTKNNDETNLLEEQYQSEYNVMQVFSCEKESLLERYSIKSPKIQYTLTYNHRN